MSLPQAQHDSETLAKQMDILTLLTSCHWCLTWCVETGTSISVLSLLDEINEDLEVGGCLVFPCDGLSLFPHSWTKLRNHDRGEDRFSFILNLPTADDKPSVHRNAW